MATIAGRSLIRRSHQGLSYGIRTASRLDSASIPTRSAVIASAAHLARVPYKPARLFHTSHRRQILPPLPRTSYKQVCRSRGANTDDQVQKSSKAPVRILPQTCPHRVDQAPGPLLALRAAMRPNMLEPMLMSIPANDPAPVPTPNPSHGAYHWTFERLVSAALIPLTLAPFAAGSLNPLTDAVLCGAIIIHSHIGFQSCIIDYVPNKRLPRTRKLFWWGLRAATVTVAIGLYEFETNDVGLTEAIKRIWTA